MQEKQDPMNDEAKSREALLNELETLRQENRRLKNLVKKNQSPGKNGQTILIVDDNEGSREMVAEMVEELGFEAITASTSQQALDIFKQDHEAIDLIISDIVMPDSNGPDLLKEMCKISDKAKVIFMSGYAGDEIVHDAVYQIQDSKTAFIKKPFTLTQLQPIIHAQLAGPPSQADTC